MDYIPSLIEGESYYLFLVLFDYNIADTAKTAYI